MREQLLYRRIDVSHETIRSWCYKFGKEFEKVIKKKQKKVTDKWHLDEMTMKVNGECTSTNTKKGKMPNKVQITLGNTTNSVINGEGKEYICC